MADERVVQLRVNGRPLLALAEPRTLLSDFLRHSLGLTGTHVGCEHGACGACTVLVDGRPTLSCLMLAVQAEGAEVLTVEGLADEDGLHPIQQAFRERHGLQCGFCTPGMLLTAKALLERGSRSERGRDPRPPRRQRLPLHRLRRHRRGRARTRRRCSRSMAR